MKPHAGGEYVYIRDAYGPAAGVSLRMDVVRHRQARFDRDAHDGTSAYPRHLSALSISSITSAVARPLTITYGQLVAIAAAALITGLNYIGIKRAGDFQVVFTALKIVIIVAIALLAFTASERNVAQLRDHLLRREGRDGRIHGCAGRRALGVRRMERPQHGQRRDSRSRTRDSRSR